MMARNKTYKPHNPFIYEGYEGPDYFCDREKETQEFISNLKNGRNITLVSPRKIGKTGLIMHAFNQIRQADKEAVCIYDHGDGSTDQFRPTDMISGTVPMIPHDSGRTLGAARTLKGK